MIRPIPDRLITLSLVSALSACASLPQEAQQTPPTATTTATPYVDYWQTRDPSEYRQSSKVTAKKGRKGTPSLSPDVVVSPDTAKNRKTGRKGKGNRTVEPAVSMILPAQPNQPGVPFQPLVTARPGAVSPGRAAAQSAAIPSVPTATVPTTQFRSGAKGKRMAAAQVARKGKFRRTVGGKKDLWGRVRERSVLADVQHHQIEEQIAYLKRNPGYLGLLSERSKPYLHYIVEQLDRRGLPMDLALVPMVESAFQPTAMSPKAAAGLWQIIPSTGTERGLVIAEGYDGRLDVHTSTDVALGYLRFLHKKFKGDWLLALAAYNAGPGAVQNAIEVYNREAAQAAIQAAAAQAALVKKIAALEAAQAAQAAAAAQLTVSPITGQPINPALMAGTPTSGQTATSLPPAMAKLTSPAVAALTVPAAPVPSAGALAITAPTVPAAISATPAAPVASPVTRMAGKKGKSAKALKTPIAAAPPPPPKPPAESIFWQLKLPKETRDYVPRILALSRIVANPGAYGVRLQGLGNEPYLFRVDLTFTPEIKLADVLTKAGISSEDFFRFNPGLKPDVEPPPRAYSLLLPLQQAQNLAMNLPGAHLVASKKYTVRKGETLATIAKRHGVPSVQLAQWNHLEVDTVLKAGQELIVYPSS